MQKESNKVKFVIGWSSCIFVLLLMIGFGVSSSFKTTKAAAIGCPSGYVLDAKEDDICCRFGYQYSDGKCCPSGYAYYSNGWSGTKGCYKVQLSEYTHVADGNYCYLKTNTSVRIEDCHSADFHNYEMTMACSSGNINENGECVQDATGDDHETEDGNCNVTSCEAGKYLTDDENGCKKCVSCPSNKYCPEETTTPKDCPSTKPYSKLGSKEESDCVSGFCYQCNGTSNILYWGSGTGDAQSAYPSCGGGWHELIGKTESTCTPTSSTKEYEISYSSGGGSGTMSSDLVNAGSNYTIKNNVFTRNCYSFTGWSGSDGKTYSAGGTISNVSSNITLTAQWGNYSCGGNTGNTNPPSNDPSTPSSSSQPTSSEPDDDSSTIEQRPESSNENVEVNPDTGEITIFIVWVVAAMAIVYSIWYFKQVKEN